MTPSEMMQEAMITATDSQYGSVYYWGRVSNVKWEGDSILSFDITETEPDEVIPKSHRIDAVSMLAARVRILEESVARGIAYQMVGAADDWDIDADGADALVQVACFGMLKYG